MKKLIIPGSADLFRCLRRSAYTSLCMGLTFFGLTIGVAPASSSAAVMIEAGFPAYTGDRVGFRLRNFDSSPNDLEIFIGRNNLGVPSNRNQSPFVYQPANEFSFTYDGVDTITAGIGGTAVTYSGISALSFGGALNAIQFTFSDQTDDLGEVAIIDLVVDGVNLGDFSPPGFNDFTITGFDPVDGVTISGTLNLAGTFANSSEASRVQFRVGHDASVTATPSVSEPSALMLMATGLIGLSALTYTRRFFSIKASA